jgi:hypothetical protein
MPKPYASTIINAPADTVWSYIRDFANLHEWLPSIETCEIEGGTPANQVGAIRRLTATGADAPFRERLVLFDDEGHSYAYEFVDSPLPLDTCRAQIRLTPVTDTGQTFAEWWSEFTADDEYVESMTKFLSTNVYGAGLAALRDRFA